MELVPLEAPTNPQTDVPDLPTNNSPPDDETPSQHLYPIAVGDTVVHPIQPQGTETMSVLEAGSSQNRDPPLNQVESIIRILNGEILRLEGSLALMVSYISESLP